MRACPRHLTNFMSCCARKGLGTHEKHLKTKQPLKGAYQATKCADRARTQPGRAGAWPGRVGSAVSILRTVLLHRFELVLLLFFVVSIVNSSKLAHRLSL